MPALLATLLCLGSSWSVGRAAGDVTNLGPPSSSIPHRPQSPMGAFRRLGTGLSSRGKAEVLFVSTQVEGYSAAETWPLVKALQQFGRLSNLAPITTQICSMSASTGVDCRMPQAPPGYPPNLGYATFDLDHARYQSRYLTFVVRDLIDRTLHLSAPLRGTELALFDRYVGSSMYHKWDDVVWHAALDQSIATPPRQLPLLVVSRYVETGPTLASMFDLETSSGAYLLPFATVQGSLRRGRAIAPASPNLVTDFNEEANVITALICRADRLQPRLVCGRAAIGSLLKHIR